MFACEPSAADPTFRRVFVTDRLRCALPLPQQTAFLAESGAIDAVILREKDLDDAAYELLAAEKMCIRDSAYRPYDHLPPRDDCKIAKIAPSQRRRVRVE